MDKGFTNYHAHCHYCDGNGTIGDYVDRAIRSGFKCIGFSSHAPLPFPNSWTMKPENFSTYKAEVLKAKKIYADRIDIFLGLEVDYIPSIISPTGEDIKSMGLDYTIGAIHFLGLFDDGTHFTVDGTLDELRQGINEAFDGDTKKAVQAYYELYREMLIHTPPDIAAHLDLIKRNNVDQWLFKETDGWYRDAVEETLDVLASTKVVLEINTGGITRNSLDAFYPSNWILQKVKEKNIPIMVNSDAHKPDQLSGCFEKVYDTLSVLGFESVVYLTKNGWETMPIPSRD